MTGTRGVAGAWLAAALAGLAAAGCSGLARVDGARFPPPARNAITFWGHACVYIDLDGIGMVTDPDFQRTLLLRRRFIGAPPPASYAAARVVLISHAHDDHLSPATLATFSPGTSVLCPHPAARYLKALDLDVRAMSPGDTVCIGGVRITGVAAHHMGGRHGVRAAADGRAMGWVIESDAATIFYSGDTNYFSGFSNVGWTYRPDVAILNVNGHLMPPDAARAAWALGARAVVPIHWGAYGYWLVGGNRQPRDEKLLERLIGDRLVKLEVGEALPLDRVPRAARPLP